eukprot:2788434-Prymnesium_polylepis.1
MIEDASYARMLAKLQAGSPFEWSYVGMCPHPGNCRCPRWQNMLKDGKIARVIDGRWKPVYPASAVMRWEASGGVPSE